MHDPFFRIIRKTQPSLPIVLVSRPDFELNPADSHARRDIIRQMYENALAARDRHVWMVDGESLFGTADRDLCTVDDVHPNDLSFLRMADALEPLQRVILSSQFDDR